MQTKQLWRRTLMVLALLAGAAIADLGTKAAAATPPTLDLKILLVGNSADPSTSAWQAALESQGVPYTLATSSGSYGSETVTLPTLSNGSTGLFNGVVLAGSPSEFAAGSLDALDTYEATFAIRQIDGYAYPTPSLGLSAVSAGPLDGTTGQLTAGALAALPELKGPLPFDTGTYGYPSSVTSGAPFTPWLLDSSGNVLAGVYQHPSTDLQANVQELVLTFDYGAAMIQWLLLAPGLVNWVTHDTHLGLYRNYFGEAIDDVFLADNEWSSLYQCTPAAVQPVDVNCPPGVQGNAADGPPDQQMTAADVAYVANWEQQTGIRLDLAFNGVGACTAPSTAAQSSAVCDGSATIRGSTYADPGQAIDSSAPNDAGLVDALLANKSSFNWINHTWSHLFLGCTVWQGPSVDSATGGTGGALAAGTYSYLVTAATAYGESEPSTPAAATVGAGGSVALSWPDATNGGGPSLWQLEAKYSGGSGFWGYDIFRADPGSSTYGLVAQVPEDPAGATASYSFTDTGSSTPGAAPATSSSYPTATNPGIECAGSGGADWLPATSSSPDSSIEQEIGMNDAFAAANGLPNFNSDRLVTGEYSGLENPNMAAALAGTDVSTIAADASRQPGQYTFSQTGGASTLTTRSAPRYPSNIYYNASNWPDQINEYNTLYVARGTSIGDSQYPNETGQCVDTSSTTCRTTPATEATILASESRIMLAHVLDNNPRVGYAHQSNLIGPATTTVNGATTDQGYTLLRLLDSVLAQYHSWYDVPLQQVTLDSEAQLLAEQGAWGDALGSGTVAASEQGGVITITNSGSAGVEVPVTTPPGTLMNGSAFGQSYGGDQSDWLLVGAGASQTLATSGSGAPTITSTSSATATVGSAFSFTVTTNGSPAPSLTETGALASGISFADNGDGTATISGTPATGTGGAYPITIGATNTAGSASQAFTLTVAQGPTITSTSSATATVDSAFSFTVTTSGSPAPSLTETGALASGISFADNGDGTATISGTPATGTGGAYPITIGATNTAGSASQAFTLTVNEAPTITSASSATATVGSAFSFTVTTSGYPYPTLSHSALPGGLAWTANGNGTATISGTPTAGAAGVHSVSLAATNALGSANQTLTLTIDRVPGITSGSPPPATVGQAYSFTVTTYGYPTPSITESGQLPAGLAFADNGNGTATISGTATTGSGGTYPISITASNAAGTATKSYTMTVREAPAFTSPSVATGAVGTPFSFVVTTTGYPYPSFTHTSLPKGLSWSGNGNGTATISGTPTAAGAGVTSVLLTAKNPIGSANMTLVITVTGAPVIRTGSPPAPTVGQAYSFTVTTYGYPTPSITESGQLPAGLAFADNGNGTATISGTATTGSGGTYPISITASNAAGTATKSYTMTVREAPAFTSPSVATGIVGTPFSFSVTTTGYPYPSFTHTRLPKGLSWSGNGNGTATISGTPKATGSFPITITVKNALGSATQTLTIMVNSS